MKIKSLTQSRNYKCSIWALVFLFEMLGNSICRAQNTKVETENFRPNLIKVGWVNLFSEPHHLNRKTWCLIPNSYGYSRLFKSKKSNTWALGTELSFNNELYYNNQKVIKLGQMVERHLIIFSLIAEKYFSLAESSDLAFGTGFTFRKGFETYFLQYLQWEQIDFEKWRNEPGILCQIKYAYSLDRIKLYPNVRCSFFPWQSDKLTDYERKIFRVERSWYLFSLGVDVGFSF